MEVGSPPVSAFKLNNKDCRFVSVIKPPGSVPVTLLLDKANELDDHSVTDNPHVATPEASS